MKLIVGLIGNVHLGTDVHRRSLACRIEAVSARTGSLTLRCWDTHTERIFGALGTLEKRVHPTRFTPLEPKFQGPGSHVSAAAVFSFPPQTVWAVWHVPDYDAPALLSLHQTEESARDRAAELLAECHVRGRPRFLPSQIKVDTHEVRE